MGVFCLFITTLLGCFKLPVSASERKVPPYILDTKRQCKLSIKTDINQGTAGEVLEVYQVGRIDATSLSLSFVLNEEFEASKVNLMEEGNAKRKQVIETLYEYAKQQKIAPMVTVKLDETGTAELLLPQGAYVIYQRQGGQTEKKTLIQAAMVGLPGVGDLQDAWVYELEIQLKATQETVTTGDWQDPILYVSLAGASLLLLGLLMLARKRG